MAWIRRLVTQANKLTYKDGDSDIAQSGLEVMAAGATRQEVAATSPQAEPGFVDSFLKRGGRLNALANVNKEYPAVILHEKDIVR